MRKLSTVLVICLAIIGVASMAAAGELKYILATGGTAGTYYPFGGAMAKIWNSKIPGMNVTAQATGASVENIRLMGKDEVELALVQSDNIDFAFKATGPFKEKITAMGAVAVLYPEIVHIIVRADSKAKTFKDLKGLKVSVGAPGSGTEANFRQLMEVYNLKKEDIIARYLSYAESADQFKDNHIDSFFMTTGVPNSALMDVSTSRPIKLLAIEDGMIKAVTQKYPFLAPAVIPANSYKGQTETVKTIAVMAVLVAHTKLSEDTVYKITKSLFDNQAELAMTHAKGKELQLKSATVGVSIPFHPGAAKFYREKGVLK
ncbi:MAG: TAXI family TRAP transporter solute-binding subunit [Candidatus Methylomirabilota bacterium]